MLLIVAHHYVVNSGLTDLDGPILSAPFSWRSQFLLLFGAWGKTCINCFVFITGYFMCRSRITARKLVKLLLEIEFYKIVIWLIFLLTGYQPFSVVEFIKALLPIHSVSQNFSGCYLLFYLCIPFLNTLIGGLTEKGHLRLIALTGFIYVVLGTLPKFDVQMNYVSWFCVLYFISSYVRLYPKRLFERTSLWGILLALNLLVSVASVLALERLATLLGRNPMAAYYLLSDSNKVLAVFTAFSAFMFFKNVSISYNARVNAVAASTFGVLMIHANSDTMRQFLWQDFLGNTRMYASPYLVPHAVGSVLAIFIVCIALDKLRIALIEQPLFRLWDRMRSASR